MPHPPFSLPETWFRQLSLEILSETSSALRVLLDMVKPVKVGAQGDHASWVSTEWNPCLLILHIDLGTKHQSHQRIINK